MSIEVYVVLIDSDEWIIVGVYADIESIETYFNNEYDTSFVCGRNKYDGSLHYECINDEGTNYESTRYYRVEKHTVQTNK